jgi:hypothetical protein
VPSKTRLHRSVGISSSLIGGNPDQKTGELSLSNARTSFSASLSDTYLTLTSSFEIGSVMAVQLLYLPTSNHNLGSSSPTSTSSPTTSTSGPSSRKKTLHILIGYESGQLALLEFIPTSNFTTNEALSSPPSTLHPVNPSAESDLDVEGIARPVKGRMIEENEGWSLVWVEKCHRDARKLRASLHLFRPHSTLLRYNEEADIFSIRM